MSDISSHSMIHSRLQMVQNQLVARGIRDVRVLEAMRRIPREPFVLPADLEAAYEDRALQADLGQTISQPFIVAFMTEALEISDQHRVLEIGTGTGYQTAILSILAGQVHTVERLAPLSTSAKTRLEAMGCTHISYHVGDGSLGWPDAAPFDRIIVTADAPTVPEPLVEQLAETGRMILPVGEEDHQRLLLIEKRAGRLTERALMAVRFVRLIGAAGFPD